MNSRFIKSYCINIANLSDPIIRLNPSFKVIRKHFNFQFVDSKQNLQLGIFIQLILFIYFSKKIVALENP